MTSYKSIYQIDGTHQKDIDNALRKAGFKQIPVGRTVPETVDLSQEEENEKLDFLAYYKLLGLKASREPYLHMEV